MKYIHIFSMLMFSTISLRAQAPVSGCNGQRYVQQVFADHVKTVVPYGANIGAAGGNPITMYMDVYTPKNDTAGLRPAIVLAHGGTFIFGDKSDMANYCIDLAKRGYVAVSVQYRLYPVFQLGVPDSIKIMRQAIMAMGDMKAAIRALRVDAVGANQFKVHPQWIFCGGYSAGAVAAMHLGQLDTDDTVPTFITTAINDQGGLEGSTGDATNRQQTSDVKGIMSLSGGLYTPNWIDSSDKPMFSIHGTADDVVFYTSGLAANLVTLHGSGNLHARADQIGLQNTLKTVTGGGHSDIYSSTNYAPVLKAFIDETCTSFHNMFCTPLSNDDIIIYDGSDTWSAYPNPTSGLVQFVLPHDVKLAQVKVYSAFGKYVQTASVSDNATLDLSSHPSGLYLLEMTDQAGKLLSNLRVVKQ
jgi:para-nitrobenzyl esterase